MAADLPKQSTFARPKSPVESQENVARPRRLRGFEGYGCGGFETMGCAHRYTPAPRARLAGG